MPHIEHLRFLIFFMIRSLRFFSSSIDLILEAQFLTRNFHLSISCPTNNFRARVGRARISQEATRWLASLINFLRRGGSIAFEFATFSAVSNHFCTFTTVSGSSMFFCQYLYEMSRPSPTVSASAAAASQRPIQFARGSMHFDTDNL